jgi:hypothetical protein
VNVTASFKPFSAGAKSATVVIESDARVSQTTLNLTGVGQ